MSKAHRKVCYLMLRISKYAAEGYALVVFTEAERELWRGDDEYRYVMTVDVDLAGHQEWLAERSETVAQQLLDQAAAKFAKEQADVQEFRSKFLLLGVEQ